MINPLLNPFNSLPLLKNYFMDPSRLQRLNHEKMKKYRDKAFKKIVKYAYTIPLYHDKYKKEGVHPNDIKDIDDIVKLPMVSKNDMREGFPDKILPVGTNKNKKYIVCTGGTTGKSISIYTDFYTMGKAIGPALREIEAFDLNWRKINFAHIGNFNPCRIDLVYQEHFYKYFKSIFSVGDSLNLDVSTTITNMINKLNKFKPDIILSYPAVYQHLAFLKRKDYGKNITPTVLYSAGSILDDYTRKYVQDVFRCPLLNTYQSVEAHGSIATECIEGTWHVHSDFFNVEAINENDELVAPGERGHLVMTRLWGRGTPMIRYTGMDDWVRVSPPEDCDCGLSTPVIKGGVEGRIRANIILPNGKIFPPGAFCFIEPVLYKYKTFKIRQYQIVQNKIDDIDVFLFIDENLRDEGVSVKTLIKEIKNIYEKKVGPDVSINVEEVSEIKHPTDASKPPPIVVSNVKSKDGYKILNPQ